MANIYCTKKLEKIIGKNNIITDLAPSIIGDWNANVFYINRKKYLFFINDKTCYSLIIPNFVKKDLSCFNEIFYSRFFNQLNYDGIHIDGELSKKLIEEDVNFMSTNNNRSVIGTMTQFLKDIDYFLYYHDEALTLQELNHRMTDTLVKTFSTKKYESHIPIELMQELLSQGRQDIS